MSFFPKKMLIVSLALVSVFSQGFLWHRRVREDVSLSRINLNKTNQDTGGGAHTCRLSAGNDSAELRSFGVTGYCPRCGRSKTRGCSKIIPKKRKTRLKRTSRGRLLRKSGDEEARKRFALLPDSLRNLKASISQLKSPNPLASETQFLPYQAIVFPDSPVSLALQRRRPVARVMPTEELALPVGNH